MTIKILEQSLKQRCTPEIIKKMCELASYLELKKDSSCYRIHYKSGSEPLSDFLSYSDNFPLLIHRSIEGWNKDCDPDYSIDIRNSWIDYGIGNDFLFSNYQPESLTHAECAMLHCLLYIFEEALWQRRKNWSHLFRRIS